MGHTVNTKMSILTGGIVESIKVKRKVKLSELKIIVIGGILSLSDYIWVSTGINVFPELRSTFNVNDNYT
jgi:hypothetical protein